MGGTCHTRAPTLPLRGPFRGRQRSFGIADWQTAISFNMLPDQPSFGVGDIRVQDLRLGVDAIRKVYRDIQVGRITVAHTVKGDTSGVAFHPGCRRPVECAYPLAYPPAAPSPTDVDRVLGAAACNQVNTRTVR